MQNFRIYFRLRIYFKLYMKLHEKVHEINNIFIFSRKHVKCIYELISLTECNSLKMHRNILLYMYIQAKKY